MPRPEAILVAERLQTRLSRDSRSCENNDVHSCNYGQDWKEGDLVLRCSTRQEYNENFADSGQNMDFLVYTF
jgi:hypothetical protein